jgi:hypothetical protein
MGSGRLDGIAAPNQLSRDEARRIAQPSEGPAISDLTSLPPRRDRATLDRTGLVGAPSPVSFGLPGLSTTRPRKVDERPSELQLGERQLAASG